MSDEVEIPDPEADEYEVIPIDPIRRLERRIDELEQSSETSRDDALIRDVVDIMKSNQQLVNNMVQSTNNLKHSVEDLVHKMDNVTTDMSRFMDLLEEASETSLESEVTKDIDEKMVAPIAEHMKAIRETNEKMVSGLSEMTDTMEKLDRRMKRMKSDEHSAPSTESETHDRETRRPERSERRRERRSRSRGRQDREQ